MKRKIRVTKKLKLEIIERILCGFASYEDIADELELKPREIRQWHRDYEAQRQNKYRSMIEPKDLPDNYEALKRLTISLMERNSALRRSVDFLKTTMPVSQHVFGFRASNILSK